jgi:hypothetical protein
VRADIRKILELARQDLEANYVEDLEHHFLNSTAPPYATCVLLALGFAADTLVAGIRDEGAALFMEAGDILKTELGMDDMGTLVEWLDAGPKEKVLALFDKILSRER